MAEFRVGDRVKNTSGYEYTIAEIYNGCGREYKGNHVNSWVLGSLTLISIWIVTGKL